MNVLHVIPAVAARYGGPSSSIALMCRALGAQGVSTVVATTDADGRARLPVPLGAETAWNGLNVVFFEREWSEAFKYSRPLARWLDEHAGNFSVIHVHAVLSHACLAAARAARRAHVPYVVRPLGTLDSWSLAQKPWRKRLLLSLGAMRMLRGAAAIQYTSAEEQRQVESALGLSRGVVVPLGADEALLADAHLTDAQRSGNRYVLALARLHPVKNIEALIGAFVDARAEKAGWKLTIAGAGDDEYAERLKALITQHRAHNSISLIGWVDRDTKRELLRNASLFALPSLHENFGVSLVEAMAAGVPVVVSDQVHLAESVREGGAGWVTTVDRGALTAALDAAIRDDEERRRRGEAARKLATRFSWATIARQLIEMYEGLKSQGLSLKT